jgi:hypothetical protein
MRLARWHDAIGDDVEERQSGGHRGGFFVDDPWDGRRFLTFASRIPFFAPRTARRMCLPPDLRPLHGRMLRRVPRYVLVKPVVASENDLPAAIRAGREQSLQARLEDSAKCGVIAGTGLLGGGRDGRAVDPGPNHRLCAGSRTGYRSERPPEQPDRPSSWTLLIGRKPLFVGAKADTWGRRPIFLAALAILPVRGCSLHAIGQCVLAGRRAVTRRCRRGHLRGADATDTGRSDARHGSRQVVVRPPASR